MARGDQLGRQWKIIQTLLASRQGKSVVQLAGNLDCHPRTVYRDLEALQVAGFPLLSETIDGKRLWSVMDTFKQEIPIPMNPAELMALYVGRGLMRNLDNTVYVDALESFFSKIKSMLPPAYHEYLEQLDKSVAFGKKSFRPSSPRQQEIIATINEAIFEQQTVEIDYFTMSRRQKSRRRVAPYKVWFFDGRFYLIGYCGLRKEVRMFATDRINTIETTSESFEVPDDFQFDNFVQSRFGAFGGAPATVRVWFAAEAAGYIRECIWHDSQQIEEGADGSIVFSAEVAGTADIKFWILQWGAKARVIEPLSLAKEIRSEADAMAGRYAGIGSQK